MLDNKLISELREFIEFHLIFKTFNVSEELILEDMYNGEIVDYIETKRKPSLQKILFDFIDRRGATDPEIYHKAGIDRKLFSKIRSNPGYRPKKNTIIALALALELNQEEMDTLLHSAGYTLSDSETFDLIIQFCIEKKIYNIHDVNEALDHYDLKLL
ncbi:hypothetical protein ACFFF5_11240 [Lederbergia wuyishanensis]|uniref:XRE family transcriptional regulator n=1 Tax=Lederbergia wuyishanensis TaxID=1347903 RepID=A0ABU0D477_9BACI|nr:hypothetical protein [Lederbergia wuyishanensis]MCJ8008203.1 hypothetical protein [Lederbergia wuyishanensis]MDQ0343208.1 hypothetical protein [Lederbergia wuyishanensis]